MSVTSSIFLCILIVYRVSQAEALAGWIEPASPNEFPFVVSIGRKFDIPPNNPYGHTCGGAILTNVHVLTSANCFAENKNFSDYFVYVGSNDLAQSKKIEIEWWTNYECWSDGRADCYGYRFSDNDIAVVRLKEKVKTPGQQAKLYTIETTKLEGKNVKTAGWGLTFNDTTPRHMLKADLRGISNTECLKNVWKTSNTSIYSHEPNFFCTNGVTLFAVLDEGDRGSPVFIDRGNGDYRIIGVNQKAVPSVNSAVEIPDQQNKHIGIYNYMKFIRSVTRDLFKPLLGNCRVY